MGSRKGPAPVLSALLEDLATTRVPGDKQIVRIAAGELRALLAVARAAERWASTPYPINLRPCDSTLVRALNRLRGDGSDRWPSARPSTPTSGIRAGSVGPKPP